MSHRDVAHNWAHQTGKYRKSGNMFYEGATIYSWGHHWPIATIRTGKTAEGDDISVVLYTDEKRSVSTSSHTRIALQAVSHMIRIRVPDPGAPPQANALRMTTLIAAKWARLEEMRKAGSRKGSDAIAIHVDIMALRNGIRELSQFFDVGQCVGDVEAIEQENAETRDWVEAFLAAAARRWAERQAATRAAERKATLANRPKAKAKLRKWLAGNDRIDALPSMRHIWCRVKGNQLETSRGARVPLDIAKRVFALAEQARKSKRSFADPSYQVGAFKGLGITHLGTIVVGCHRIPFHTARIAAAQAGAR